jgi:hypothetical protein
MADREPILNDNVGSLQAAKMEEHHEVDFDCCALAIGVRLLGLAKISHPFAR